MQRHFSAFPGSWPGVGLLMLRIVVGGAALTQGAVFLTHMSEPTALSWGAGILAVVSGVALVVGFLTPASGVLTGVSISFITATWIPPNGFVLVDRVAAFTLTVDAAALTLLGPGAFSVDARLFGRREIIITQD